MSDKDHREELKVGDIVTLASGGPKMTIENFSYGGHRAFCKWFVRRGGAYELMTENFDVEALDIAEEDNERS